jgi:transposase
VNVALYNAYGIKLENLNGLQKLNSKNRDIEKGEKNKSNVLKYICSSEYSLNSWPFHQFYQFIEYKVRLLEVKLADINPHTTSKSCCGHIGKLHSKQFENIHTVVMLIMPISMLPLTSR